MSSYAPSISTYFECTRMSRPGPLFQSQRVVRTPAPLSIRTPEDVENVLWS
ncbi:hypothetical protein [Saccharothrix longispora]|uniref:hypothetical protein n=1 Tax=Saccharothrix longispora TaxID=33920 RepID=UPI0028FDA742|nr:hypothetical protein [Saccharothrix longispora]MDU0295125.1 hypothetical protein [Saccharothrix longispora]